MLPLQHLAAIALNDVIKADEEYFVRKTLRWYSRTFHTPLSAVERLPLEEVFQAYFETTYEEMSQEERVEAARVLSETPDQYAERKKSEENADDDYAAEIEAEARAIAGKKKDDQTVIADLNDSDEIVTPEDLRALDTVPEMKITFDSESNLESTLPD